MIIQLRNMRRFDSEQNKKKKKKKTATLKPFAG